MKASVTPTQRANKIILGIYQGTVGNPPPDESDLRSEIVAEIEAAEKAAHERGLAEGRKTMAPVIPLSI